MADKAQFSPIDNYKYVVEFDTKLSGPKFLMFLHDWYFFVNWFIIVSWIYEILTGQEIREEAKLLVIYRKSKSFPWKKEKVYEEVIPPEVKEHEAWAKQYHLEKAAEKGQLSAILTSLVNGETKVFE